MINAQKFMINERDYWKARAEKAEAELAAAKEQIEELEVECDEASDLADATSSALDKIGAVGGIETWDYAEQPLQAVKAIVADLARLRPVYEAAVAVVEKAWVRGGLPLSQNYRVPAIEFRALRAAVELAEAKEEK